MDNMDSTNWENINSNDVCILLGQLHAIACFTWLNVNCHVNIYASWNIFNIDIQCENLCNKFVSWLMVYWIVYIRGMKN